ANEIHPPSVVAFGHLSDDGSRTESHAFAVPYRTTQLFHPDAETAERVDDYSRFADREVQAFPAYLGNEVGRNVWSQHNHLTVHPMMEGSHFGTATWWVCAPSPKPSNATGLLVDWHFAVRTGVSISATKREDEGCVVFTATQSSNYRSLTPRRKD